MKKTLLVLLLFLLSFNSYADAICNDGWISKSSGSGTCSWHEGVKKWLDEDGDSIIDILDGGERPPCRSPANINGIKGQSQASCESWRQKQEEAFIKRIREQYYSY
jgi:hypothetical protein